MDKANLSMTVGQGRAATGRQGCGRRFFSIQGPAFKLGPGLASLPRERAT
jgi:hypothetical protein